MKGVEIEFTGESVVSSIGRLQEILITLFQYTVSDSLRPPRLSNPTYDLSLTEFVYPINGQLLTIPKTF